MKENDNITQLSDEQLFNTLTFAQSLNKSFTGLYSPWTQHELLVNLNNLPSSAPTHDKIDKALSKIPVDEQTLQRFSEFFEVFDMIYNKTIEYYEGILAFDLRITCNNYKDPKELDSKEYKEDLKRVYKFLDRFGYKQEFRKAVRQMLRTDSAFYWFRDSQGTYDKDEDALDITKLRNFSLHTMPQDHCIITDYCNKSTPLYEFDMDYFTNASVDIDLYDPWFRTTFNAMFNGGMKDRPYIPHSQLRARKGIYTNYVQTSPKDGAWAFKFSINNFSSIPPLAGLMRSVMDNDTVAKLQIDKDMISAYYLLAGEIGMMDGLKSGEKANQTKFDPQTLGTFMNLVTSGLKNNVKPVAMPLENIRGWQYTDSNPSSLNTQLTTSSALGNSASPLIYQSGSMSQAELQNAILTDYNKMAKLYPQFENFLDFFINKKTKKYKFTFKFTGSTYDFEREKRQTAIKDMASLGLTLGESAWASAFGFEPQEFSRLLDEAHYGDLQDKLTILANLNTMNTTDVGNTRASGGRPQANDTELTDKGEESRNQ